MFPKMARIGAACVKLSPFCVRTYSKFEKESPIILTDLEFLGEKIDGCKNDVENSSTRK